MLLPSLCTRGCREGFVGVLSGLNEDVEKVLRGS